MHVRRQYRLEMESIKPSFDVLLQTGLHRGHYGRNLYKKRRAKTSKGSRRGADDADGAEQHGRSREDDIAAAAAAESRYLGDRLARLSALHGDSDDKRKAHDRQQDRERAEWMGEVSSAARHHKTPETGSGDSRRIAAGGIGSRTTDNASPAAGSGLAAMVMRASRLSAADLDDASPTWSSHATLRRSADLCHHFPRGAAVISVEELPRPQRGTYLVQETEKTFAAPDADRASSSATPSRQYWRLHGSSAQSSGGPYDAGVRPISLHGDELMTYVNDTESSPREFTLDAILARQEQPKHQRPHLQSTGNVYTTDDDDIGQLYRLLDSPFSGRDYERTVPKQHVS